MYLKKKNKINEQTITTKTTGSEGDISDSTKGEETNRAI